MPRGECKVASGELRVASDLASQLASGDLLV